MILSKAAFVLAALISPSLAEFAEFSPVAEVLATPPGNDGPSGLIPPLLRSSAFDSASEKRNNLVERGYYCDPGYYICSDGAGCCPVGTYCGIWGGKRGCCPNGKICTGVGGSYCTKSGYAKCSGDNFCCPYGYYCYRDSAGNPKCSSGSVHTTTHYTTHKTTTHYTPAPSPTTKHTTTTKKTTTDDVITIPSYTNPSLSVPTWTLTTSTDSPAGALTLTATTPTLPTSPTTTSSTFTFGASSPFPSVNGSKTISEAASMIPVFFGMIMGVIVALVPF